jgi:4-amino-4-deoxy-L-arabinose transferase-like glycosyltransferase
VIHPRHLVLPALFTTALLVRLAAFALAVRSGRFPEFWEYEYLARNLLAGKGYLYFHMHTDYRAYIEPLYPFVVAAVYAVTQNSTVALAIVQCLIASTLALIIYEFARRTFGGRAGIAAGFLVSVHPALAGYSVKFHPLVLDSVLIALVGLMLLRLLQEPGWRAAIGFGVALGFCILTRPTVLAFVVPALVWMLGASWGRPARVPAVVGLLIALAVVAPWVVRNYLVLGTFVLTQTKAGFVFWLGNNPAATGGAIDPNDPTGTRSLFDVAPELRGRVLATPDELEQNRIFRDEAVGYVLSDPVAFAGRWVKKLGYFWWFPPYGGRRYPGWQVSIYMGFYVLLLTLALAGVVPTPGLPTEQRHGLRLTLLALAGISVTQALFYVDGRHRLGVEALLVPLSGHGLVRIVERLAPRRGVDYARVGST